MVNLEPLVEPLVEAGLVIDELLSAMWDAAGWSESSALVAAQEAENRKDQESEPKVLLSYEAFRRVTTQKTLDSQYIMEAVDPRGSLKITGYDSPEVEAEALAVARKSKRYDGSQEVDEGRR